MKPLYEKEDVDETLPKISTQPYGEWRQLSDTFSARFINAGHILGSGMIEVRAKENGREISVLFSGDVGRYDMPLNLNPDRPPEVDYLVVESTYGNRKHPETDPFSQIQEVAQKVIDTEGILMIPSFAVGRAQQLILILRELFVTNRLPRIPIHLDSPMAVDTTKIYCKYPEELLRWLKPAVRPPKAAFVTHGEPEASHALAKRLKDERNWRTFVPKRRDTVELA